jgi:hypothetical protein
VTGFDPIQVLLPEKFSQLRRRCRSRDLHFSKCAVFRCASRLASYHSKAIVSLALRMSSSVMIEDSSMEVNVLTSQA